MLLGALLMFVFALGCGAMSLNAGEGGPVMWIALALLFGALGVTLLRQRRGSVHRMED